MREERGKRVAKKTQTDYLNEFKLIIQKIGESFSKKEGKHVRKKGFKGCLDNFLKYLDKSSNTREIKYHNPVFNYLRLFFRKFKKIICLIVSAIIIFTISNKEEPLKKGKRDVTLIKPSLESVIPEEELHQIEVFTNAKEEGYLVLEESFSAENLLVLDTHGESIFEFTGDYEDFYLLLKSNNVHEVKDLKYYEYKDLFSENGILNAYEDLSLGIYDNSDTGVDITSVCSYKENAIKPINDMLAKYNLNDLIKENYKKEELAHILSELQKSKSQIYNQNTFDLEEKIPEARILIMDTQSKSVTSTFGTYNDYYLLVYTGPKSQGVSSYADVLNSNAVVTIADNYAYGSYRDLKNPNLVEFSLSKDISIPAVKSLSTFLDELNLKDYIKEEYTINELQDLISNIHLLQLESEEKEEKSYNLPIDKDIYVLEINGDINGEYPENFSRYQFLTFTNKSSFTADRYIEIYYYDDILNHGATVETFSNGFGSYRNKANEVSITYDYNANTSKILPINEFLQREGLEDLIKKSYSKKDLIEIQTLLQNELARVRRN